MLNTLSSVNARERRVGEESELGRLRERRRGRAAPRGGGRTRSRCSSASSWDGETEREVCSRLGRAPFKNFVNCFVCLLLLFYGAKYYT